MEPISEIDKLPYCAEAERIVIGTMLLNNETINAISNMLVVNDFNNFNMGILFDTIINLYREGKTVDVASLEKYSEDKPWFPIRDMKAAINMAADDSLQSSIEMFAEIVLENSEYRKMTQQTIYEKAEKDIGSYNEEKDINSSYPIASEVMKLLNEIEKHNLKQHKHET